MAKKTPLGTDDRGRPIWGYSKKDPKRPCCGYPGRHGPCQRTNRCPNGRCAQNGHGGSNKGRPIIHGLRSEALRGLKLAESFEQLLGDPQSLDHYENIATTGALANDLLANSRPAIETWKEAVELYDAALGNTKDAVKSLKKLGEVLRTGLSSAENIDKAITLMDEQRKHKLAQARREEQLDTSLNIHQTRALFGAIQKMIELKITDRVAQREFTEGLARLLTGTLGPRSLP